MSECMGNIDLIQWHTMSDLIFLFYRVLFRLYWYPTKVLYSSAYISVKVVENGPFYFSFNVMLIALFTMQVRKVLV